MKDQSFNELYGNRGVDTSYEREQLTYRPANEPKKEDTFQTFRPEIRQSIERSRAFTITQNLSEYDELVSDIEQMLKDIEARNSTTIMSPLKEMLVGKQFKSLATFERERSGYNQTGDIELYSLLFHMKASCVVRRDFIDERYRTQLTNETSIEKIEEAELASITQWETLESKVLEGYQELAHSHDDEEGHTTPFNDDSLTISEDVLSYEVIEELEKQKRSYELLHTSLADHSYIHRNRYFMFLEIVEKAKILTYHANSLINRNLKELMMNLQDIGSFVAPKSHLILQFRKFKEQHESIKGRMMTIDDEKESFASEKQYMYQQLETKTIEPVKTWLYNQEEESSGALDIFSQHLTNSMLESRQNYESTLADMLNFYKSEADFYDQQIYFLKNKEEIRKFYRILEDLEDVDHIRGEWVDEYLNVNGYTV